MKTLILLLSLFSMSVLSQPYGESSEAVETYINSKRGFTITQQNKSLIRVHTKSMDIVYNFHNGVMYQVVNILPLSSKEEYISYLNSFSEGEFVFNDIKHYIVAGSVAKVVYRDSVYVYWTEQEPLKR